MNNDFDRPEILAQVPLEARRILDVGCGTGRLGAALLARQECEVVGIEADVQAVAQARERGLTVLEGDCEDAAFLAQHAAEYDCLILADILEHLRDPELLLRRLRIFLTGAATLIISVPNGRNWQVIAPLMEGLWAPEEAGLMDRTHLQLFTRRRLEQMLDACGYGVLDRVAVRGSRFDEWAEAGKPGRVQVGRWEARDLAEDDAMEFFVYQWLLRAAKYDGPDWGLTSLVIPVCNHLLLTQACIASVRKHTSEPHEIILVDNGSEDGTAEWAAAQSDIRYLRNEQNLGFPRACNQGLEVARGQQLLLLNNDTIVTPGWLRRMIECMRGNEGCGLVGPRSNNVSGPQQIKQHYETPVEMERWAWDWSQRRRSEAFEVSRLVGFCLLIDRAVFEQIGPLDEQFGLGSYEDDDYCRRAEQAGFRCLVANDSFVHHVGGQTFAGQKIDLAALMAQNAELYRHKWAGAVSVGLSD